MLDLERLENTPRLLDLLVTMEDILDGLDIYVFRNWVDGEVIEGPIISRHWAAFSLLYKKSKMPDPKACLRLMKHNINVEYSEVSRESKPLTTDRQKPNVKPSKKEEDQYWMVKVTFPRELLDKALADDLEMYGDEVDTDDVQDAADSGINAEDAYHDEDAEQIPSFGDTP